MRRTPWFRSWFGDEVLALYPHRDQEEAREAVELLLETTGYGPATPVLDLACGAGRHVAELVGAGLDATGLDLSAVLLRPARETEPAAHLVRGDMRCPPFRDGSFRVVTNFFTSFGYFQDAEDDRTVLGEARGVLAEGGRFLLDFLNAERVRLYEPDELEAMLRECRLEPERTFGDYRGAPYGPGAPRLIVMGRAT